MDKLLAFLLGLFVGAFFEVVLIAIVSANKEDDE